MRRRSHRTLVVTVALALACSATALGAGPLNGKTYEGGAPSWGTNGEGHRLRTHASGNIVLRVSGSGRSVTVRFTSSAPVLFCNTQQRLYSQSTKSASISGSGAFKAAVGQRFAPGPGLPAIVQVLTGKFYGHTVRGTIHTQAAECSGVTSFSATAR